MKSICLAESYFDNSNLMQIKALKSLNVKLFAPIIDFTLLCDDENSKLEEDRMFKAFSEQSDYQRTFAKLYFHLSSQNL